MSIGATAGASGGGAAAGYIIAQAIKASGVIVRVNSNDFMTILRKNDKPLVVLAKGGFLSANYKYLTSYKGLAFFTKSKEPLLLNSNVEVIEAKKIWIPD